METSKPLIAVLDDDRSVVKSLARVLRLAGYEVSTFGLGREFLASLGDSLPRCLVLDVHMPEMSGLELQSHLRALGCEVPIVFITAHDTLQTRAAASQGGALGLLCKPFGSAALLDLVGKAVEPAAVSDEGP